MLIVEAYQLTYFSSRYTITSSPEQKKNVYTVAKGLDWSSRRRRARCQPERDLSAPRGRKCDGVTASPPLSSSLHPSLPLSSRQSFITAPRKLIPGLSPRTSAPTTLALLLVYSG